MQNKKILIVGSGIIGLFSAYYLTNEGFEITIIDKSDGLESCSIGNAGMIVPSHFIPLASPGMIEKGIKWMFDAESPFYVKPRLNLDLLKWGITFYKSANKTHINNAKFALRDLSFLSKKAYQELNEKGLFEFGFEEKGLLMLCKTQHGFDEESEVAETANSIGIEAKVLNINEIHQLEPEVKPNVAGGIYYPGDAHLYPNQLVENLKKHLKNKGVNFLFNSEVLGFNSNSGNIESVIISHENKNKTLPCDELIIATGSWSQTIAKGLKINIPMQAGKGYSITKNQVGDKKINIPSILLEARVAITPMAENYVRFGGTMEIGGINNKINRNRVKGIIKSIPQFYPDYELTIPENEEIWHGLRPCPPDGMPYIGRSKKYKNLCLATGHAMMGLSLAPGTGQLIGKIVMNKPIDIDMRMFGVDRF